MRGRLRVVILLSPEVKVLLDLGPQAAQAAQAVAMAQAVATAAIHLCLLWALRLTGT